jgi:hypothetical protein
MNAPHLHLWSERQSQPLCRGEIDDADFRASIQQKVQRLDRFSRRDFDPEQSFAQLIWELRERGWGGLQPENCSDKYHDGRQTTTHAPPQTQS